MQQIEFLVKFYSDRLPFKKENIDLVKAIIVMKVEEAYTIRGKTGWTILSDNNIGWYYWPGNGRR